MKSENACPCGASDHDVFQGVAVHFNERQERREREARKAYRFGLACLALCGVFAAVVFVVRWL